MSAACIQRSRRITRNNQLDYLRILRYCWVCFHSARGTTTGRLSSDGDRELVRTGPLHNPSELPPIRAQGWSFPPKGRGQTDSHSAPKGPHWRAAGVCSDGVIHGCVNVVKGTTETRRGCVFTSDPGHVGGVGPGQPVGRYEVMEAQCVQADLKGTEVQVAVGPLVAPTG